MTIKTWSASQFSKQKNSTKQPSTSGTNHTVRLKDGTSIVTPTIIFSGHLNPSDICFAQISDFGRYYFKTDFRYVGPETEIDFESDPMGSFKSDIGDYEAHIIRCQDPTWYNNMIPDPMNPTESDYDVYSNGPSETPPFSTSAFVYILTVIGKTANNIIPRNGMATTYIVSAAGMMDLIDDFNNASFLQNLINEFTNPMDAVVSCKIIPMVYGASYFPSTEDTIYIGTQATSAKGKLLVNRIMRTSVSINVPSAVTLSNLGYKRAEPYTTYSAYLPFVGNVNLSYPNISSDNILHIEREIDLMSGDIAYGINQGGEIVATYGGSFATDIPMSNKSYSGTGIIGGVMGVIGGIAGTIASLATGGAALPALGALAAGIGATVNSLEQKTQINGTVSSFLGVQLGFNLRLICSMKKTAAAVTGHLLTEGLPCNRADDYIRSHSGYIQVMNPSVTAPEATITELNFINSQLSAGFFYQ